jgi:hypothetical protein
MRAAKDEPEASFYVAGRTHGANALALILHPARPEIRRVGRQKAQRRKADR